MLIIRRGAHLPALEALTKTQLSKPTSKLSTNGTIRLLYRLLSVVSITPLKSELSTETRCGGLFMPSKMR